MYKKLDRVGIDISLERDIVCEQTLYRSWIWCEWTDGIRGCCEQWSYEGESPISTREALELASKEGWILFCDRPVCGCHADDDFDDEISDLTNMENFLNEIKP